MAGLSETEQAMLELERTWWRIPGGKEQAIRERFGLTATRYYQLLDALIDRPEAMLADPMLIKRLKRIRESRSRVRAIRRTARWN